MVAQLRHTRGDAARVREAVREPHAHRAHRLPPPPQLLQEHHARQHLLAAGLALRRALRGRAAAHLLRPLCRRLRRTRGKLRRAGLDLELARGGPELAQQGLLLLGLLLRLALLPLRLHT